MIALHTRCTSRRFRASISLLQVPDPNCPRPTKPGMRHAPLSFDLGLHGAGTHHRGAGHSGIPRGPDVSCSSWPKVALGAGRFGVRSRPIHLLRAVAFGGALRLRMSGVVRAEEKFPQRSSGSIACVILARAFLECDWLRGRSDLTFGPGHFLEARSLVESRCAGDAHEGQTTRNDIGRLLFLRRRQYD
jgi:hypothetical protein